MPIFSLAAAEIFVLGMILFITLVDAFFNKNNKKFVLYFLTQATLVISFIISACQFHSPCTISFEGQFILDPLACLLKCVIYLLAFLVFWYSRTYNNNNKIQTAEFYLLSLLSILGSMVLISAASLLTLYLGLELLSLPLYALVAIARRRAEGSEAAIKYFIMGALASGLLLYGMSLIYGMTGSLLLSDIAAANHTLDPSVFVLGLVLVIVAICFKLGAIPFHLWVPDVYEGAPTSVALYVATIPKVAAFGMLCRLILQGMPTWNIEWQEIFMLLGALSLFGGNLMALVQTNLKRLLAYSTIANVGFILIALGMGSPHSAKSALIYLLVYVFTTAGVFGILLLLSKAGIEAETFEDLKGLNKRNSWLAFMLCLLMLSMAGIPPLLGFDAKLLVIYHLMAMGKISMAIFALVMSVIGSYYYLRVIKYMYFDEPDVQTPVKISWDLNCLISLNSLVMLALGIFPNVLFILTAGLFP